MIGRVKNIVVEKGYCFLRVTYNQQTTDYFAHKSGLRGVRVEELVDGDVMQFTPTYPERGPRAEEIRRASSPDLEDGPESGDFEPSSVQ